MRSEISDQDLTDYALNELGPEERLYVESMLAVSEECRNDVYEMIDMAMLLEKGFEREDGARPPGSDAGAARRRLLNVRVPNHFLRHTAARSGRGRGGRVCASSPRTRGMPQGAGREGRARFQPDDAITSTQAVSADGGEDFVSQLASCPQARRTIRC